MSLHFIPPTSNICERFFSLAKLVYSKLRKAMKRTNLEMIVSLPESPFVEYGNGTEVVKDKDTGNDGDDNVSKEDFEE